MKAIQVKYLGPTNTQPSRVKAIANGVKSMTVTIDHGYTLEGNAFILATTMAKKYGWLGKLVSGQLSNGDYVFCFKNQ